MKYDIRSGARQLMALPQGVMAGEPCFVPAAPARQRIMARC
ncbi:hypothetical protein [Frigidibacter sp.]|nr:hypothetical protein [Frigidibacter sp.]MDP3340827.1 hypothetical protein [Frigidibacter sp.]